MYKDSRQDYYGNEVGKLTPKGRHLSAVFSHTGRRGGAADSCRVIAQPTAASCCSHVQPSAPQVSLDYNAGFTGALGGLLTLASTTPPALTRRTSQPAT